MSKNKILKNLSRDVSRLIEANSDQTPITNSSDWYSIRKHTREYLIASKTAINWVSGMIYQREKNKRKQEQNTSTYHRKFLQKLKKYQQMI